MLKLFARYTSIGAINTLIHWIIFAALYSIGFTQSMSNFAAFCCAVTFSFFANAKWTFDAKITKFRYTIYLIFMGGMATAVGMYADQSHASPIITLVTFSTISLVCGFIYSKHIVFKD